MEIDIAKIDKKLAVEEVVREEDVIWRDVRAAEVDVYGLMDTGRQFVRMPIDIAETVSDNVAELNLKTTGGRVRFTTDSEYVAIRCTRPLSAYFSCKMTYLTYCGFDMYEKREDGKWEFVGVFKTKVQENAGYEAVIHFETRKKRDLLIHFPLFSEVYDLFIGVQQDAILTHGGKYTVTKPVVYYGSSITHGGCASRPGTCYTARCSMDMDYDYINLGFSGSAKGEKEMAEYLAALPMSVFVMDYDFNSKTEALEDTHRRMYEIFRKAQPKTPIIFATQCTLRWKPYQRGGTLMRRAAIFRNFGKALAQGDDRVWCLDGQTVFPPYGGDACTMDGIHPNDLGFYAMSKAYGQLITKALEVAEHE